MKYIYASVALALLFSGCTSSSGAKVNNSVASVIQDECGSNDIKITDIKGRTLSNGFMKVQVSGENVSSTYQLLEYKVMWFDEDGFVIESILSKWQDAPAYATQAFHVSAISPSSKAKTFRLYIRKDKEVICDKQTDGY